MTAEHVLNVRRCLERDARRRHRERQAAAASARTYGTRAARGTARREALERRVERTLRIVQELRVARDAAADRMRFARPGRGRSAFMPSDWPRA